MTYSKSVYMIIEGGTGFRTEIRACICPVGIGHLRKVRQLQHRVEIDAVFLYQLPYTGKYLSADACGFVCQRFGLDNRSQLIDNRFVLIDEVTYKNPKREREEHVHHIKPRIVSYAAQCPYRQYDKERPKNRL